MEKFSKADGSDGIQGPCRAGRKGWVVHDTLIEVVQIIEKDKSNVQPSQGQEEGEEEQAKPDTVALQRGRRETLSMIPISGAEPSRMAAQLPALH